MEKEEAKKTNDTPEEEEKKKKEFIARLTAFIVVGFVAPIIYLIVRYNLFTATSGLQIGLWGVVVFAIVIGLVGTLCWYYLQSMKFKYSILKQIISGALKVLAPLLIVALFLQVVKDNVDMMIESLWVFFGCEALAIPLNPLPKWAFENNISGAGDIAKQIYDKITKENAEKAEETEK